MGQSDQNAEVLFMKVRAAIPSPAWEALPKSQRRSVSSHLTEEPMCLTDEDPHAPQRHLCVPAEAVPFLIIFVPQTLQTGFDIPTPC